MTDFGNRAEACITRGEPAEALRLAKQGEALGEPRATALIGFWHLAGEVLPRDLPLARRYLARAAEAGDEGAALAEISLTANGSGGTADWAAAVTRLRKAAQRFGGIAAEDLALLEAMALDSDGYPLRLPATETLCDSPQVRVWRQFLTPRECEHIALCARDVLASSMVADPQTGRLIAHPIRTSAAGPLGPTRETLPVQAILRRIARATGTDLFQGESLTVLHYGQGQQYRDHLDTLPGQVNQRVATVILYLNEGYAGGETQFSAMGMAFKGRAGDALFFRNVRADGSPDPASRHAGLPVSQGVKWVATRWLRAGPFDVWNPD